MRTAIRSSDSLGRDRAPSGKLPILTYHSIDDGGFVISTAPAVFRRQMRFLRDSGYNAITLSEAATAIACGSGLPARTVVLTFDDGFRNFYTEAFPTLREYNFKATVFLVTNFCGKKNDWSGNPPGFPRSDVLSWQEVRELDAYGIEFGSHTKTHPDLTRLSPGEAEREMVESKTAIADALGAEPNTFAYPFGKCTAAVKKLAAANYAAACSTDLGKVSACSDLWSLKRIDMYYLSNQRLFEILRTSAFDNYMLVRQALRDFKALLAVNQ
jgi:peptidoglycan/xylan/chitin deacetylase (PgdA/CDA1 family)